MAIFKKSTAVLCAITMLGGVALPLIPSSLSSVSVSAASVKVAVDGTADEIVVKDFNTGEVVSSERYIETYNAPKASEFDTYEEDLLKVEEDFDDNGRIKVRKTYYYRAEHYVSDGQLVIGLTNSAYKGWIVKKYKKNTDQTHFYIIRDCRIKTERYSYGEKTEVETTWSIKKAPVGLCQVTLTREDGETYRNYTFRMKQPTTSLSVSYNAVGSKEKVNLEAGGGAIIVSNHPIQINAVQSAATVDGLKYSVVKNKKTDEPATIATVSEDGVLTPTGNGTVYLKIESTAAEDYYIMSIDKKTKTVVYNLVVPEYYTFTIVKENPAAEVKVVNKCSTLNVGDKRQLKLKVTPSYNTDEYPTSATDVFTWATSNKKVITVDANGAMKAVGAGEARITVTGENALVKDSFVVKVLVPVTGMEIDKGVQLYVGESQKIFVKLRPNYSNEAVTWTVEDSSIVKVTSGKARFADGAYSYAATLKGLKAGTTKVTASTASGIKASMTVTVKAKPVVDSIQLLYNDNVISANTCNIFVGQTIKYQMLGMQGDEVVNSDTIKVSISKNGRDFADVAIDENGLVTCKGLARGSFSLKFTSTITPTVSRTIKVNIKRPADSITSTVDGKEIRSMTVSVGTEAKVAAELKTNSVDGVHDDKISTYKSNNTAVATVDKNGNIKVVGEGTAKIVLRTASAQEFNIVNITAIKVAKVAIKGVTDGAITLDTRIGKALNLTVTAYDSKNKKYTLPVEWQVDKSGILSINNNNDLIVNKVGTAQVACTVGTITVQFKVTIEHAIKNCNIEQTGEAEIDTKIKPALKITDDGILLKDGVDYTVDTLVSPVLGRNKVTITGKGNYTGTQLVNFNVVARDISKATVTGVTDKVYTGEAQTVTPIVKYNNVKLTAGTDYTVSFRNNTEAGTATVTIAGIGNYKGKHVAEYKITPANLSQCVITVNEAKYVSGKAVTPGYTVKFRGKEVAKKNFTVTCANNTTLGVATIRFTGQTNFTGTVSKNFIIYSEKPLKITPSVTALTMTVGSTKKINVTIADAPYIKNKTLTYKSSSNGVATVDSNGNVKAIKKGTAKITISGGSATAIVTIEVK